MTDVYRLIERLIRWKEYLQTAILRSAVPLSSLNQHQCESISLRQFVRLSTTPSKH